MVTESIKTKIALCVILMRRKADIVNLGKAGMVDAAEQEELMKVCTRYQNIVRTHFDSRAARHISSRDRLSSMSSKAMNKRMSGADHNIRANSDIMLAQQSR